MGSVIPQNFCGHSVYSLLGVQCEEAYIRNGCRFDHPMLQYFSSKSIAANDGGSGQKKRKDPCRFVAFFMY